MLTSQGAKSASTYVSGGKRKFVGTKHLKQSESGSWFPLLFCSYYMMQQAIGRSRIEHNQ